jgi:hypothetical protein
MNKMSKSRNWCFTINNYETHMGTMKEEEYLTKLCEILKPIKYIIIGFEIGKEGTKHIQGYLEFENPRTLNGITKNLKYGHWEARKGTATQAIEYCKKENNFFEFGEKSSQGKRSDLNELKESIFAGKRVDEITNENPMAFHQYGRTLNKLEDLAMRKIYRTEITKGIWYHGPTGVGKSHKAFENYNPKTHYIVPNDNGWWDGYTQQETVILNDFRGEIPYNEMLQLLDKWPYHVKRRHREPMPFTSKRIIITCSIPPEEIYNYRNERDNIEQLLRRLEVINLVEQ